MKINIIGAGLAGSEAAIYLANRGFEINLYEMRPTIQTGAHKTSSCAEFVCSNSLGATDLTQASGLLKEEMKMLDGTLINIAHKTRVPSGNSLSIDRFGFSNEVTKIIENHKNINIIREEVKTIDVNVPTIVASGPLTSEKLAAHIINLTGEDNFHFFDAIAPIVEKSSIDFSKAFYASRYQKGEPDFINCPFNKAQYENFYNILINAKKVELKDFEAKFFEGCLPVEVIASRGFDTLRYGPMKPIGLVDSKIPDEKFYAVCQLRQDDKMAELYNLVGFQTNLVWGEQKKLINSIPGLENANIVRYGVMHANCFINSPKILNPTLQMKNNKNIFFAGQITGVEGYNESMATGLLAGINMARYLDGEKLIEMPDTTMLGALTKYITYDGHKHFQPVNSNWGIIAEIELDKKTRRDKKLKNSILANRAIENIKTLQNEFFCYNKKINEEINGI